MKEDVVDPDTGSNAIDDDTVDVLQDSPEDPELQIVRGIINGLDQDKAADLGARLLGRGDYAAAQWPIACATALERRETASARYILGTPNAADLINQGLAVRDRARAELLRCAQIAIRSGFAATTSSAVTSTTGFAKSIYRSHLRIRSGYEDVAIAHRLRGRLCSKSLALEQK